MESLSKICSVGLGGNKSEELREQVVNFYNHYFKMVHKAAYDVNHEKGAKILKDYH